MARGTSRISWPVEHGGYLTAAGAALAASWLAPAPLRAAVCGLVLLGAFMARGPLERAASGLAPRAWDHAFLAALAMLALLALAYLGAPWAFAAAGAASTLVVVAVLVRRARLQRDAIFEAFGMGLLGASAGLAALAGGASLRVAIVLGAILGVHAAAAVPLVRTLLRKREREHAWSAALAALALVAAAAVTVAVAGAPLAALALVPRTLHALVHPFVAARVGERRVSASPLGAGETCALIVVAAIIARSV